MNSQTYIKKLISKYRTTAKQRKSLEKILKDDLITHPHLCEICSKPMTYKESILAHMFCSVNPKDRYCCEMVFCCKRHTPQETYDFMNERRLKRKLEEKNETKKR